MTAIAHPPWTRRRLLAAALAGMAASAPRAEVGAEVARAEGAEGATEAARAQRSRDWFTDTLLTDQDGQRHRFYSDLLAPAQPRVALLHALFTSCSSACPLIVQKLHAARAAMPVDAARELWILSLSVDPLNDTPQQLKAFAVKQGADGPRWRFLTGAPAEIERVTRRLGLWTDEPDAHQTTLIAGRARSAHWVKLRPDAPAPDLARQLQRFWSRPPA